MQQKFAKAILIFTSPDGSKIYHTRVVSQSGSVTNYPGACLVV